MDELPQFQIVDDRAEYRPTGQVSADEAARGITVAIARAKESDIRKLLVVGDNLTGFPAPDVIARYRYSREWSHAGGGLLHAAFVFGAEMIDRQKFGVLVAENRGLVADVFPTEKEALAWLHDATG